MDTETNKEENLSARISKYLSPEYQGEKKAEDQVENTLKRKPSPHGLASTQETGSDVVMTDARRGSMLRFIPCETLKMDMSFVPQSMVPATILMYSSLQGRSKEQKMDTSFVHMKVARDTS